MKTNYKILSAHFKYSNPGEYKIFYIGNEPKTNTEIVNIYKENKGSPDIDLILIEDLTYENEIQFDSEYDYSWLVEEIDGTYRFLQNITNYNGDISKLILARIIYDEIRENNEPK